MRGARIFEDTPVSRLAQSVSGDYRAETARGKMPWPHRQREGARPVRKSALHDRWAARNACFGEAMGWERPLWFAPEGVEPVSDYSWRWPNWLSAGPRAPLSTMRAKSAGPRAPLSSSSTRAHSATTSSRGATPASSCSDSAPPFEAGLGFTVRLDKPLGFIGRDALLRQREAGPLARRLVMFRLHDSEPVLFGEEVIRMNGRIAGYVSSGAYGFTLGTSVGMDYIRHPDGVTRELVESASREIEIACERYPAEASLRPFYDPAGTRVRS